MQRLSILAVALLAAALGCATPDAPAPARPPHLALAESLVAALRPEDTAYQHEPTVVVWPSDPGHDRAECRADCSGFVSAVLRRAYDLSESDLAAVVGAERPRAKTFHDAIVAGRGFRVVALDDARPGDVLAIRFPAGSEDTGHVMFLASAPRRRAATAPVVEGTTQWELDVLDSTGSPHGTSDSRHAKSGRPRTGAGRGTIRVYVDKAGAFCGYTWSTSAKSPFRRQETRDAALGRFEPPTSK